MCLLSVSLVFKVTGISVRRTSWSLDMPATELAWHSAVGEEVDSGPHYNWVAYGKSSVSPGFSIRV